MSNLQQIFSFTNPKIQKVLKFILRNETLEVDDFCNIIHYKMFEDAITELSRDNIERVFVSENYLLIKKKEISEYLVLGIDSETGNLFFREVYRIYYFTERKSFTVDGIDITIIEDRDVRQFLGYNIELDEFLTKQVSPPVRVRVQGDIILEIVSVNREKEYRDILLRFLTHHLRMLYVDYLLERIRESLEDLGFHVEIRDKEIVIEVKHYDSEILDKFTEFLLVLLSKTGIIKEIEKEFNILVPDIKISEEFLTTRLITLGGIIVKVELSHFLTNMIKVEIEIDEKLIKEKANELLNQVDITYRERTVKIGRHKVFFKSLPTDIVLRVKIFNNDEEIQIINLPLIIKGEIRFVHPEHSTVSLYFPIPVQVLFSTIPSTENFIMLYNYYRLKEILQTL